MQYYSHIYHPIRYILFLEEKMMPFQRTAFILPLLKHFYVLSNSCIIQSFAMLFPCVRVEDLILVQDGQD